jgi:hypothetical protein
VVQLGAGAGQLKELRLVGVGDHAQRDPAGLVRLASLDGLDRRLGPPGEFRSVVRHHSQHAIGTVGSP